MVAANLHSPPSLHLPEASAYLLYEVVICYFSGPNLLICFLCPYLLMCKQVGVMELWPERLHHRRRGPPDPITSTDTTKVPSFSQPSKVPSFFFVPISPGQGQGSGNVDNCVALQQQLISCWLSKCANIQIRIFRRLEDSARPKTQSTSCFAGIIETV